jgi:hypothetical protein
MAWERASFPTPSKTSTAYSSDLLKGGRCAWCVLNCTQSVYLTQSRHLRPQESTHPPLWPPLFGALTASACLHSSRFTSPSMRRPPGSRRAQFGDNGAPTLPHFHRRPPVPLQDCTCVLHSRHQKHHNSIDVTGAHAPTTEPQPQLSSSFARRLFNQTVTKPCSLPSKCGRIPSATSPNENLGTNSG